MGTACDESDLYCEYYDIYQLFNLTDTVTAINVSSADQNDGSTPQCPDERNSERCPRNADLEQLNGSPSPQNTSLEQQIVSLGQRHDSLEQLLQQDTIPEHRNVCLEQQNDHLEQDACQEQQNAFFFQEDFIEEKSSEILMKPFKGFDLIKNNPELTEMFSPQMETNKTELPESQDQSQCYQDQLPVLETYGSVTDNMHLIIIGKDMQVRSEISDKTFDLLSEKNMTMKMSISSEIKITKGRSCAQKQCTKDREKSISDITMLDDLNRDNNVNNEKIVKCLRNRDKSRITQNRNQNSRTTCAQKVNKEMNIIKRPQRINSQRKLLKNDGDPNQRQCIPSARPSMLVDNKSDTQDFQCKICGYKTKTDRGLRQHFKYKHDHVKKEFRCIECEFKSKWISNLYRHLKKHGINQFTYRRALLQKMVKSSKVSPQSIVKNSKKLDKKPIWPEMKKSLKKHSKNDKAKSKKPSQKCMNVKVKIKSKKALENKKSKQRYSRFSRLIIHDLKTDMFQCKKCSKKITRRSNMVQHIKYSHSKSVSLFNCNRCGYRTKYNHCLKRHMLLVHKNRSKIESIEKPFKCTKCEFSSRWKQCLVRHHSRKHNKNVSKAKNSKNVKQHKSKLFSCTECEFSTKYPASLNRHVGRVHRK